MLVLFFTGCARIPYPSQDLILAWERETGNTTPFVEKLNCGMAQKLGFQAPFPKLGIVQMWDGPVTVRKDIPLAALWVSLENGGWYQVLYGWWGKGTGNFALLVIEEIQTLPDGTG